MWPGVNGPTRASERIEWTPVRMRLNAGRTDQVGGEAHLSAVAIVRAQLGIEAMGRIYPIQEPHHRSVSSATLRLGRQLRKQCRIGEHGRGIRASARCGSGSRLAGHSRSRTKTPALEDVARHSLASHMTIEFACSCEINALHCEVFRKRARL